MPRKIFLSFALILSFAFYIFYRLDLTEDDDVILSPISKDQQSIPESSSLISQNNSLGIFKDGEFVGSVADANYGKVQVKAIVQGGKITDVRFLDYPHNRGTSVEINIYALPVLKAEIIRAQSAQIDIVSGATFTSKACHESLANALAQAKK